jgi:FAD synthetase
MRVLLFGTFDHLHPGHEFVIREAMRRGDVTVIVARDRNVQRIKKRKSEQSEQQRLQFLRDAFPSITAMLGDSDDFLAPVRNIEADLILLGYDQALPPGITEGDLGCPVERLPAYRPEEFKSSKRRGLEGA